MPAQLFKGSFRPVYTRCSRAKMYAIPALIIGPDSSRFLDGIFFHLPAELASNHQMNWYARSAPVGWSVCPQSYHVYAAVDAEGNKHVLPGLLIKDGSKPKKK